MTMVCGSIKIQILMKKVVSDLHVKVNGDIEQIKSTVKIKGNVN